MASFILNFGKYKGQPIEVVTDTYLSWLSVAFKNDPILRGVVQKEARKRGYTGVTELREAVAEIWYNYQDLVFDPHWD